MSRMRFELLREDGAATAAAALEFVTRYRGYADLHAGWDVRNGQCDDAGGPSTASGTQIVLGNNLFTSTCVPDWR